MCGFVGVVSPHRLDADVLAGMNDRLSHRGPDGARMWISRTSQGEVGLAHRRLAIIDLSHAADQPMFSPDGSLALVYNGEIYNYIELREQLRGLGHSFASQSDTEVLLEAYRAWGPDALPRLNGMFAFALWDEGRQRLFVARDRFGEKPLFYTALPDGGIAFASEMKALFAYPGVDAGPHAASVDAYTRGDFYEDGEQTLFSSIRRVLQAQALIVDSTGTVERSWRYWTPDYTATVDRYDEAEARAMFRQKLQRSIAMRLRSDVPVGTSLSGGLDSSSVVCLLDQMRASTPVLPQNTFSGRFDDVDPTLSEGEHIDLVVRRTGVTPHAVTPTAAGLVAECERLHWHQEEPFLSASIYLQWCVMRLSAQHDTTVLLDGQGADELLAGYQYYFPTHQLDLLDRGRIVALVRETVAFRRRLHRASRPFANSSRRFNRDVALTLRSLAPLALRRSAVWHGPYDVGVPPAEHGGRLRRQIAEALLYNSLPQLLRYADRNAMAFSRETRFPFLDHDLVDWCIRLPDRALVKNGWQKYLLRRAMDGVLPREIQWRADKVGYAAPLDLWLRDELKEWAWERLFRGPVTELAAYDRPVLDALWREHQAGANNSWALWRWISLNEWFALIEGNRWKSGMVDPPHVSTVAKAAAG